MTALTPGWHFCSLRDGVPVLRDGTPLVIGQTYEHTGGKLRMCESGYHDSLRVIDALKYAPGPYLCRTLASGDVTDRDKRVSRYRQAIAGCDVTMELHDFATRIAYCALLAERERGREPDPRSWKAIRIKRLWMAGEATDANLSSAESAAWSATWSATWSAAAWSAARSAAEASESAAESAAAAAWAAAQSAAAWAAADEMLIALLPAALREAV